MTWNSEKKVMLSVNQLHARRVPTFVWVQSFEVGEPKPKEAVDSKFYYVDDTLDVNNRIWHNIVWFVKQIGSLMVPNSQLLK